MPLLVLIKSSADKFHNSEKKELGKQPKRHIPVQS